MVPFLVYFRLVQVWFDLHLTQGTAKVGTEINTYSLNSKYIKGVVV